MKKLAIFVSGSGTNTASRGFSSNPREQYWGQASAQINKAYFGETL